MIIQFPPDLKIVYIIPPAASLKYPGILFCLLLLFAGTPVRSETPASATAWHGSELQTEVGIPRRVPVPYAISLTPSGQGLFGIPGPHRPLQTFSYLEIELELLPPATQLYLVWQRTGEASPVSVALPPPVQGHVGLSLAELDGWQGEVDFLAIGALGQPGLAMAISRVEFHANSLLPMTRARWRDWTRPLSVSQSLVNLYPGSGSVADAWSPVIFALALLATILTVLALLYRRWPGGKIVLLSVLVSWLALDLLWQTKLARQASADRQSMLGKTIDQRLAASVGEPLLDFCRALRTATTGEETRYFIAGTGDFNRIVMQYCLLPLKVYWGRHEPELPGASHLQPGDYIVAANPSGMQYDLSESTLQLPDGTHLPVKMRLEHRAGRLYQVL